MQHIPLSRRRGWRRLPELTAMAAAAVLALAACSSSGGSSSGGSSSASGGTGGGAQCSSIPSGPIKISAILPLTGPLAEGSQASVAEANIAVNYFNAHDSVCGHKYSLSIYNDKGDPATSLGLARQLVTQGDTILIDDSLSSAQNEIQPYLMQQHVLVMTGDGAKALWNTAQNPTDFNYLPSNDEYAQLMVNYAKAKGYNNVGILSDGTSFSVELATDTEADAKAAGLNFVKTITYSPTAIDLTTQVTEAKEAGIQTLFPTGFTGVPAMVAAIKQIGWSPHIVGWGGLAIYGVTASQVPAGTVDGCYYWYAPGQPTSHLLTSAMNTLLTQSQAKVGLNFETAGIIITYVGLQIIQHAIETANSLDGQKLAAAVASTTNLPTIDPDVNESFTPDLHVGFPQGDLKECTLQNGPFDIRYAVNG
jgi:branched-chain amino acid transport system substrate-binding protein